MISDLPISHHFSERIFSEFGYALACGATKSRISDVRFNPVNGDYSLKSLQSITTATPEQNIWNTGEAVLMPHNRSVSMIIGHGHHADLNIGRDIMTYEDYIKDSKVRKQIGNVGIELLADLAGKMREKDAASVLYTTDTNKY